jgi:hypothetical protein
MQAGCLARQSDDDGGQGRHQGLPCVVLLGDDDERALTSERHRDSIDSIKHKSHHLDRKKQVAKTFSPVAALVASSAVM